MPPVPRSGHISPALPHLGSPALGILRLSDLFVVISAATYYILQICSLAEAFDAAWLLCGFVFCNLVHSVSIRRERFKRISRGWNSVQPSLYFSTLLTITRFTLERFPFLIPRIILSNETTGVLLKWRHGQQILPLCLSNAQGFTAYRLGTDASMVPGITILYIHGGGFAFGSISLYTEVLLTILRHVRRNSGTPAECIVVDYSKVTAGRFPTSLLECLRAYAHLIEVEKIDPSTIVLCGDSAGGNLAMAMLLCLSGQSADPQVNERDWSAFPMPNRAVLLSPWLDLRTSKAAAYASLRKEIRPYSPYALYDDNYRTSKFRDPWLDYIAPEALAQLAQLYTGVLERPRRVAGPASALLTHLDAILERKAQGKLTYAFYASVRDVLKEPLITSKQGKLHSGERISDAVPESPKLYAPISSDSNLECNPLVSPTLGDWSRISLNEGMCVFWGKNEELAGDIEAWVASVQTAWTCGDVAHAAVHGLDKNGRLETNVESSAFGVHIWPLVCFYTGRTVEEREYGLQAVAKAIVGSGGESHPQHRYIPPDSPNSMPSDYEENAEDIDGLIAWKRGIIHMGVEPPPNFVYSTPQERPGNAPPAHGLEMPLAEPPFEDDGVVQHLQRTPSVHSDDELHGIVAWNDFA